MPLKTGRTPKPKDQRVNRNPHLELGIVPVQGEGRIPKVPDGLLPATRRIWRAYWSSQVSGAADKQADAHRILRWIHDVDEYGRARETFQKARLVRGSMGQPALNPLAQYLSQIKTSLERAEAELGLTPMARLRLGLTYGQAMLTAAELNRQLSEGPSDNRPAVIQVIDGEEWEAV